MYDTISAGDLSIKFKEGSPSHTTKGNPAQSTVNSQHIATSRPVPSCDRLPSWPPTTAYDRLRVASCDASCDRPPATPAPTSRQSRCLDL